MDHKIYSACRIILASTFFAALHSLNYGTLSESYVDSQIIGSFIAGIGYGILKERRGISAAVGAHAIGNFIACLKFGWAAPC